MTAPDQPLVSVSIVTFEGERWIEACLQSVLAQEYGSIEVLVTENGSRDRSAKIAQSILQDVPRASVDIVGENLGFAGGHNRAIDRARGDIICLLNQDAVIDPRFISTAVAELRARPRVAAMQGLILRLAPDGTRTDVIDTTGLVVLRSRRFLSRGAGDSPAAYAVAGPVFGADGPAPVYRAAALASARITLPGGGTEVFDGSYFLYHEDTDLAWRLRLMGWEAWFAPEMVAWHARGLAGPADLGLTRLARRRRDALQRGRHALAWRNHQLTLVKNDTGLLVVRDFPFIAARLVGSWILLLLFGPQRRRTVSSLLAALPAARAKRRQVQQLRVTSGSALETWFRGDRSRPGTRR